MIAPQLRISQGQFWTVSDLKIAVQQCYAVSYRGESSYRRMLHECGLSQQQTEKQYRSRPDQQTVVLRDTMSFRLCKIFNENQLGLCNAVRYDPADIVSSGVSSLATPCAEFISEVRNVSGE